jgi:hypothetical protein
MSAEQRFFPLLFAALILVVMVVGCVPLRPYHTSTGGPPRKTTQCDQNENQGQDNTCIRFVEYDDFGNLFSRAQLNETIEAARLVAEAGGIVIVYVHGWEHNASDSDDDLKSFRQAVHNAQTLDRQYGDKRTVLGVYVGWRGKSLNVPGLSKLTFWERKTTAHSVGDGAVFELFRKLADHRVNFPNSRLVLVGHSFGAAVTYSSVSHSIMDQIIKDPLNPIQENASTRNQAKRWDMVVLLNPAFEAMQLRPHFELALSQQYPQNQLPHLILITTEADWATGIAFPAGRFLRSTLNKYADDRSADMYRTAVGHYLPFVTHQLSIKEECAQFIKNNTVPAVAADTLGVVIEAKYFCFDDKRAMLPYGLTNRPAQSTLLTRCEKPGECVQVAGNHYIELPPHMPIMNIRTTREVMSGHNDIWNPTMQGFLVQLMLYIVEGPTSLTPPK